MPLSVSEQIPKSALELVEGLLHAAEPHQLEAFKRHRISDPSVTLGDLKKARRLLLELVEALEHGSLPGNSPSLDQTLQTAKRDPAELSHTQASETERRPSDLDTTAPMTPLESAPPPPGPSTGTAPSQGIPAKILDIDKYAVLCAWSEVHPDRRDAIHQRYGLTDEAARKALDARMEQHFRVDASLRAAFAQRLRLHLSYLRRG